MADKDDKKTPNRATPTFDPKPVNVGGESLVDRIYPHRKKIGVFVLTAFAIWGVIAIVLHFRDRGRESKTDKLASVLDVADRRVVAVEPPVEPPVDPSQPPPVHKEETFKDTKARADAVLDKLAKTGADAAGPTFKASLLVQAGKLDEAITEYKRAQNAKGLDGVLAREGLGLAQEMKAEADKDATARQKGLEEALATFNAMQPDEQGPRRAYALYHQGRIQALLGKTADAKATFEKAKEAGKDSTELAPLVDERLAALGT